MVVYNVLCMIPKKKMRLRPRLQRRGYRCRCPLISTDSTSTVCRIGGTYIRFTTSWFDELGGKNDSWKVIDVDNPTNLVNWQFTEAGIQQIRAYAKQTLDKLMYFDVPSLPGC